MITNAIRELLAQRPFIPFKIHLTDGQAIPVRHPDMLIISPGGSTAVTFVGDEALKVVQLVQVTTLETTGGEVIEARKPS